MCRIMEDIRVRGIKEGIEQGREEGMEKGLEQGIEKGSEQELVRSLRSLIANAGVTLKEALRLLGVPENEWEKYTALVNEG